MERIVHYIGGIGLGGSQSLVVELYRHIDKTKIQFDFVIFEDQNTDEGYKNEILRMGGKIYPCPRYSFKAHRVFCKWWNDFFDNHPEYKIIHGHVYSCASVYLPIAKKHGLVTICHAHSTSNGGNLIVEKIKKAYEFPLRWLPDYKFACSKDAGRWLYGEKATHDFNYYLIPNCIDVNKFNYDVESRRKIRNQYGISESAFVIGHVGSFRTAKNHEFIIETFSKLQEIQPNVVLLSVGIGDRFEIIQRLCSDKGLENSVIFAGNQHNIEEYYSAVDCFFFPSLWEGLPVSVVEAQASGLPCLISDTITQDVILTNLITTMSLKDNIDNWVKKLLEYSKMERIKIDNSQKNKLMGFDSIAVARWMQDFYLQQFGSKD